MLKYCTTKAGVLCEVLEGTEAMGAQKRNVSHPWVQEALFLEDAVVLTVQWGGMEK